MGHALGDREASELFEQPRADAVALDGVADGESDFRPRSHSRQAVIAGEADDPATRLRNQRRPIRLHQPTHPRGRKRGIPEEAEVAAGRGEALEELDERVDVRGAGLAQADRRPVTNHDVYGTDNDVHDWLPLTAHWQARTSRSGSGSDRG